MTRLDAILMHRSRWSAPTQPVPVRCHSASRFAKPHILTRWPPSTTSSAPLSLSLMLRPFLLVQTISAHLDKPCSVTLSKETLFFWLPIFLLFYFLAGTLLIFQLLLLKILIEIPRDVISSNFPCSLPACAFTDGNLTLA